MCGFKPILEEVEKGKVKDWGPNLLCEFKWEDSLVVRNNP